MGKTLQKINFFSDQSLLIDEFNHIEYMSPDRKTETKEASETPTPFISACSEVRRLIYSERNILLSGRGF